MTTARWCCACNGHARMDQHLRKNRSGGWGVQWFVRTTGEPRRDREVRLAVQWNAGTTVRDAALDARNRAAIRPEAGEPAMLVVRAASGHTQEPAYYQVSTF